jgi:hypothetical protein
MTSRFKTSTTLTKSSRVGETDSPAETVKSWGKAWDQFWFEPTNGSRLAALRIWIGVAALLYFLSFGLSPVRWFGDRGYLSPTATEQLANERRNASTSADFMKWRPSILRSVGDPTILGAIHIAAIGASLALTLGVATRASSIVVLVMLLNYFNRLPMITGNFEAVLAPLALYLTIGRAGDRWSVDAWRRTTPASPSWLTTIAVRLIQIHTVGFYTAMGLNQLSYDPWWNGEGVWLLGVQTESSPLHWKFLQSMPLVVNGWTHAIVAFNLAFAVLIWRPSLRRIMLSLSVIHWLGIMVLSGQVAFCLTMLAAGLSFADSLDDDEA